MILKQALLEVEEWHLGSPQAVDFSRQENSIGNVISGVQFLENDILFAWPTWLMVVSLLEVESDQAVDNTSLALSNISIDN